MGQRKDAPGDSLRCRPRHPGLNRGDCYCEDAARSGLLARSSEVPCSWLTSARPTRASSRPCSRPRSRPRPGSPRRRSSSRSSRSPRRRASGATSGRHPPRHAHGAARASLVGRLAFLFTLPVVFHCVFILGFQTGDARVAIHSIVGLVLLRRVRSQGAVRARPTPIRAGCSRRRRHAVRLARNTLDDIGFWYFTTVGVGF